MVLVLFHEMIKTGIFFLFCPITPPLGKHMNKTWEASGLTSPDGETVEFASNLVIDGAVEMWLAALESAMQTALQKLLASSLQAYK